MRKLMDIVDNRVQANLDTIRAMLLVELPADRWGHMDVWWPAAVLVLYIASVDMLPMPFLQRCTGRASPICVPCVCRSFSYEEFIATQDKFQNKQAETLCVLNEEVARAIEDVISLVQVSASSRAAQRCTVQTSAGNHTVILAGVLVCILHTHSQAG